MGLILDFNCKLQHVKQCVNVVILVFLHENHIANAPKDGNMKCYTKNPHMAVKYSDLNFLDGNILTYLV